MPKTSLLRFLLYLVEQNQQISVATFPCWSPTDLEHKIFFKTMDTEESWWGLALLDSMNLLNLFLLRQTLINAENFRQWFQQLGNFPLLGKTTRSANLNWHSPWKIVMWNPLQSKEIYFKGWKELGHRSVS